jgi:predicted ribosomally synthesized peptide with SipW-like signal peptide
MKALLSGVISLALASSLIGGGVYAYFSDSEGSTNNTFTAGSLDLKVNGVDDEFLVPMTVEDMKPGSATTSPWRLTNAGSISGIASFHVDYIEDSENFVYEPEDDVGDDPASDIGELSRFLSVRIWIDENNDSLFDEDEELVFQGYLYELIRDGLICINLLDNDERISAGLMPLNGAPFVLEPREANTLVLGYCVNFEHTGLDGLDCNLAQSDSIEIGYTYNLVQPGCDP